MVASLEQTFSHTGTVDEDAVNGDFTGGKCDFAFLYSSTSLIPTEEINSEPKSLLRRLSEYGPIFSRFKIMIETRSVDFFEILTFGAYLLYSQAPR